MDVFNLIGQLTEIFIGKYIARFRRTFNALYLECNTATVEKLSLTRIYGIVSLQNEFRMAELETPIFMRGLRRFFAVWLSGCAPQRNDLLSPISQSKSLVGLPTHTGELEPVLPAKMDVERD